MDTVSIAFRLLGGLKQVHKENDHEDYQLVSIAFRLLGGLKQYFLNVKALRAAEVSIAFRLLGGLKRIVFVYKISQRVSLNRLSAFGGIETYDLGFV